MTNSLLPKSRHVLPADVYDHVTGNLRPHLEILGRTILGERSSPEFGAAILDYYSLCFPVLLRGESGSLLELFCKCPKSDSSSTRKIYPFAESDLQMGRNEFESLQRLALEWNGGAGVPFVSVRAYIEELNCLILDRISGEEFYRVARKFDQRSRSLAAVVAGIPSIVSKIGSSLSRFHERNIAAESGRFCEESKVERYVLELQDYALSSREVRQLGEKWRFVCSHAEQEDRALVTTLKGLDIRNVIVTGVASAVLIDPGKSKAGRRESDLARFIASLRLLFWGSPLLFLGRRPSRDLEETFLTSYTQHARFEKKTLRLYLIKELFKHWCMAHQALALKNYPGGVKFLLGKYYVDRFFRSEILTELKSDE